MPYYFDTSVINTNKIDQICQAGNYEARPQSFSLSRKKKSDCN